MSISVHRFVTTAGSALNGGTSEVDAWDLDTGLASVGSGICIHIKAGNYTGYAGIGGAVGGAVTNPAMIQGYASVTGDGYLGRDASGNLITTNMPFLAYQSGVDFDVGGAASYIILDSLRVQTSGTSTPPFVFTGPGVEVVNCVLENVRATTGMMVSLSGYSSIFNSDVHNRFASSGSPTININSAGAVIGCKISSVYGSGIGIKFSGTVNTTVKGASIIDNTIYNALDAISLINTQNAMTTVYNNTIVKCSGVALKLVGTPAIPTVCINNHITDMARAIGNSSSRPIYNFHNRLRNIRLANDGTPWFDLSPITTGSGTASDFVDYDNNNYRLIDSAPGRRNSIVSKRDIGGTQGYDAYGFMNG